MNGYISLVSHLVRYNKNFQIQSYYAKTHVGIPVSYDVTFDIIQMKWKYKFTTKGIGANM